MTEQQALEIEWESAVLVLEALVARIEERLDR